MVNSGGVFDVPIGNGTVNYPLGGGVSILDVFNNSGSYSCGACSGYTCSNGSSTYNPISNDGRLLRVQFYDGSGWKTISPDSVIRSVPYAGYALSAQKLGTNVAADFLLKAGLPTCGAGTFLTWDGSSFTCGAVAGASGGTVTSVSSANPYLSVANGTSTPTLTLNVGTTANTVAAGNDSRLVNALQTGSTAAGDLSGNYPNPSVGALQGVAISATAPSNGQFFKYNGTNWSGSAIAISDVTNLSTQLSTYLTQSAFNSYVSAGNCTASETMYWNSVTSKFTCQPINVGLAGDVTGAIGAATVAKLQGSTLTITTPANKDYLKYNGTAFVNAPLAAADLTGTVPAANMPAFSGDVTSSAGSTVLTLASSGVTAGTYKSVTVDAKGRVTGGTNPTTLSGYGITDAVQKSGDTMTGSLTFASGKGTVFTDSATNTVTVQAPTSVTSYVLKLPTAQGSANQMLTNDGAGNLAWTSLSSLGVASVAVTAPITNSGTASAPNIGIQQANGTTSGYLSSSDWTTFNNKQGTSLTSANIWVGNGSNIATAVAPGGDVSMTNAGVFTVTGLRGKTVSATAPSAAGQVLRYDGTSTYAPAFLGLADIRATITPFGGAFASTACNAGQTMYWQSSTDTFQCQSIAINDSQLSFTSSRAANTFLAAPSGSAGAASFRTITSADLPVTGANGAYINGGNSFGVAATLGTNDANTVTIKTNSASRMTFDTSGNVGIGTTSPSINLHVQNSINGDVGQYIINPDSTDSAAREILLLGQASGAGKYVYLAHYNDSYSTPGYSLLQANDAGGLTVQTSIATPLRLGTAGVERMRIDSSGNVGIGTTTPGTGLEIQNYTTWTTSGWGRTIKMGSPTRGTAIDIDAGTNLKFGIGASSGLGTAGGFAIFHSDGDASTSSFNSDIFIDANGKVGMGTTTPGSNLEVIDTSGAVRGITSTTYSANPGGLFSTRGARGTPAAPTALQSGDPFSWYAMSGYDGSAFSYQSFPTGIGGVTTEAWTSTAHGSSVRILTTPNGTTNAVERVRVDQNGFVGIGATTPSGTLHLNTSNAYTTIINQNSASGGNAWTWYSSSTGAPLGANAMCFGVGTCLLSMTTAGNVTIAGTLTQGSDVRWKRDITPLKDALDSVTQLRGVTYYWKDPNKDPRQQLGLIAQEVEKVYPQAVLTDAKGYKSVAYQNLVAPLIESVKELYQKFQSTSEEQKRELASLKEENERLKKQNEMFEKRLSDLEKQLKPHP